MNPKNLQEKLLEHKQKLMAALCCLLAFLVGYGTAQLGSKPAIRNASQLANYTTNQAAKPNAEGAGTTAATAPTPAGKSPTTKPVSAQCPVKGNISGSKKIYHIPGGAFYNTVSPEQCFNTEAQAQAAGFQKSKR